MLKRLEQQTITARREVEDELIHLVGTLHDEGVQHTLLEDGTTVSVSPSMRRTVDPMAWERLKDIEHVVENERCPIVMKPQVDIKKLRALKTSDPTLYRLISGVITAKPGRPTFSSKEDTADAV